jgi:hypothetical protein
MARTRQLVERDLATATSQMNSFASKLGSTDKKTLRHDATWRRLRAIVDKYKNQLHFIDKRNKKPEPKA